jgi:hypothetical protein
MKLRTTYILFGLLVLGMGFLVWKVLSGSNAGGDREIWVFYDDHKKNTDLKDDEFKDVDTVEIKREDGPTLLFTRDGDSWRLEEPYKLRVKSFMIKNLIAQIVNARKEKGDTLGPSEYGLEDPKTVVTISGGDRKWTLNLGAKTSSKDAPEIYVTTGAHPKEVARIKLSAVSAAFDSLSQFRDTELLGATIDNVISVELLPGAGEDVKKANARTVIVEKDKSTALWNYKQPSIGRADFEGQQGGTPGKEIDSVRALLTKLTNLRVDSERDFVAERVSDEDLSARYGLKPAETMQIVIKRKKDARASAADQDLEVTLLIGKKAPQPKAPEKKDEAADKKKDDKKEEQQGYYAALSSEPNIVVWLAEDKIKPLLALMSRPDSMRDKDLVTLAESKIDVIKIKVPESEEFTLVKAGKGWRMDRFAGTSQKVNNNNVSALLKALTGPRQVIGFPDSDKDAGLDKPIAEIWLWEDAIKVLDEAKGSGSASSGKSSSGSGEKEKDVLEVRLEKLRPDKPDYKLIFGAVRDGALYVRRTDKEDRTTLLTVLPPLAETVKNNAAFYLDATLPTFATEAIGPEVEKPVSKITITHGQQTYELVKGKEGDKTVWKFVAPKEFENRVADEFAIRNVLADLNRGMTLSVAAESSKDAKSFDLDPPNFKVVIAVAVKDDKAGKTEDWVFALSKDVPGKGVYMTTNKREGIFLVTRTVQGALEELLNDIYRLDREKIKTIKISGWKKLGTVITLEAERKGQANYESKAAGTTFDGSKMEAFLSGNFHPLRARQVFLKDAPKATDDMFAADKGALIVDIAFKDDTKPFKLAIGGPYEKDGEKGFYATSSALPGVVFLLPEEPWKSAMEKPAYFTK